MIFPWMFDEFHALKKLKAAAHILAEKEDWPPLYNINALHNNKVYACICSDYEVNALKLSVSALVFGSHFL